jgi:hypothetical protein
MGGGGGAGAAHVSGERAEATGEWGDPADGVVADAGADETSHAFDDFGAIAGGDVTDVDPFADCVAPDNAPVALPGPAAGDGVSNLPLASTTSSHTFVATPATAAATASPRSDDDAPPLLPQHAGASTVPHAREPVQPVAQDPHSFSSDDSVTSDSSSESESESSDTDQSDGDDDDNDDDGVGIDIA